MIDPRYSNMTTSQNYSGMQSPQNTYSMQPEQSMQNPLIAAMTPPAQMSSNQSEASLYPYENQQMPSGYQQGYARGGEVVSPLIEAMTPRKSPKKGKKQDNDNLYPLLAELVRQQGEGEDEILAHINPIEAQILGLVSGNGGSVNPKTGLPQFSFLTKPRKALRNTFKNPKRLLADTVGAGGALLGAMTGNPFIGGAISGGVRSVIRGKGENPLIGALKGGAYGTGLNAIGSGLASIGGESAIGSLGQSLSGQGSLGAYNLSNLGTQAWGVDPNYMGVHKPAGSQTFSTLTKGGSKGSNVLGGASPLLSAMSGSGPQRVGVSAGDSYRDYQASQDSGYQQFLDTQKNRPFSEKAMDFLSEPQNLMTLGTVGLQGYGTYQNSKESEKVRKEAKQERDPVYMAQRAKAAAKAGRLSPAEMDEELAYEELMEEKKNKKKGKAEAAAANYKPIYRKQHTPAEHAQTGRWFSYYDNPNFNGAPLYARGGEVSPLIEMMGKPHIDFELEESGPKGLSYYLEGSSGGQDDKIPAYLSDGEYVLDASTVADLGDGNNKAGAAKLDQMVKNVRKHKGGSINLPPKAKSLIDYMS